MCTKTCLLLYIPLKLHPVEQCTVISQKLLLVKLFCWWVPLLSAPKQSNHSPPFQKILNLTKGHYNDPNNNPLFWKYSPNNDPYMKNNDFTVFFMCSWFQNYYSSKTQLKFPILGHFSIKYSPNNKLLKVWEVRFCSFGNCF